MDSYDPDLPEELQGRTGPDTSGDQAPVNDVADRQQRLDDLSTVMARYRDEAVKARRESGIEDVWSACEDAYLCIDAANMPSDRTKWTKPTSMVGPVTRNTGDNSKNKSTAFVRLTARYVDMGAAKVSEIILPIDDKAFSFGPTPVPDLIKQKEDLTPVQGPNGQPLMRQPTPDEAGPAQPGQPPQAPQPVPVTVADLAKAEMDKATKASEKAEQRVYDWMVESRYPMQMRKVMHDASRIGVGVLKGPFPELRKSQSFSIQGGMAMLQSVKKVAPASKWVSPWNFYPHGACGEDIHTGDYTVERDFIAEATLRNLKDELEQVSGRPLYISSQIDKVIEEGPGKTKVEDRGNAEKKSDEQYEIWHFYGALKRDDFLTFEPAIGAEDLPDDLQHVFCIISIVNDTVIRATINPLESGKFPYRTFPWSRRAGHWAGVGVGEQVSLAQSIVNAGTRRLLDNAGISSGAQIVVDQGAVVPADGNWTITPDKLWFKLEGSTADDVRKIFMSVEFPNLGTQIMAVIEYGFKLAEEACNIPLISQGQTGPQDPQTFGQAELQNSNANSLLRNIAYGVDDHITEPLVNDYYEWLLMDPDVPPDEKGDFQINARGSIAMVEKAIQEQTLAMLGAMSLNPAYGMDPKRWAEEFVKVKRMDPRRLQYSDQDLERMQNQPAPEDPRVTAAKLTTAGWQQREQAIAQGKVAVAQIESADADKDRQLQLVIQHSTEYIEQMKQSGASAETVAQLKAMLAATVMKLNTQKQLSAAEMAQTNDHTLADHIVDLHKHHNPPPVMTPPVQVPGQAANGHAFDQT